jgi:polyisoprenyl-teichoic acid--peptidoglycan teichoic acid transferase
VNDEPRDEERKDEERREGSAEETGAPEAPPPRTAAGRARADVPEPPSAEDGPRADEGVEAGDEAEAEEKPKAEETPEAEEKAEPEAEEEPEAEKKAEVDEKPEADAEKTPAEEKPAEAKRAETTGQETAEVDTLAVADREEEQEAAHAGLRARAEKTAAERVVSTGAQAAVAGAVAKLPETGAGEPPKRTTWWRFLAASFVIVASTAAATSIAFLLYLTDIGNEISGDAEFAAAVDQEITDVEGDAPQTILILGSDKRTATGEKYGRSDTTMLLRVDPEKEFLALLSLPRDLKVEIPGYGPDLLNAAYSFGGARLTIQTVKELLGIPINHVVNVDFEGFYDAINAIGCVYIDVDRHYYNPEGGDYDDIDIKPGYRKLCGYTALDYVRYRHNDNDLVRGARQQGFVREARQQIPPRSLLPPPFGDAELIEIFTDHTRSSINDAPEIIDMLKSFVDVRNSPVRQVSLGELQVEGGVGASNEQVEHAIDLFLGNDLDDQTEPAPEPVEPEAEPKPEKQKPDKPEDESEGSAAPAMIDVTDTAAVKAKEYENFLRRRKAKLPVFYPTAVVSNVNAGISEESLAYTTEAPDPKDPPLWGYKYVLPFQEGFGTSYYGVTGINWTKPPILNNPSEVRRIDGRDYMLFYEQEKLRLVGWVTDSGAYWVSNTLTRALSEDQMLAVATSVREYED